VSLWQATFIFEKRQYDDEFYALNERIEQATLASPAYLGMESYQSADGLRLINNYYWSDKKAMEESIHNPHHVEAKQKSDRWLVGYQVIIAQIETVHNHQLGHPLQSFSGC
jgi:heme-degrading monooxygenase HmoA